MKKIILFCASGMSTSLLVNKMRAAAQAQNYEVFIDAYPFTDLNTKAVEADCIMLGPQVRYQLKPLQEKFPEKTIVVIDMMAYGMMNGEKVLADAKQALNEI